MSRRVVSLCDWLPPDFGAVGQYGLAAARDRARAGDQVVLIGLSSSGHSRTLETHGRGRLTIMRVAAPPCPKERWRERLRWTFFANLRLLRAAAPDARQADEILFTGAPPFMLSFISVANWLWRKRLVYRITDFYPECLIAALDREPWYLRLALRLTNAFRRRVDQFQVLGLDQMRKLEAIGIPHTRIVIRRDPSPVAFTGREQPLATPEAIRGHTILLYSGNWGLAHDVETFVQGYLRHHREGSGRVALWLNALGAGATQVAGLLAEAGVPYAQTRPLPIEDLSSLLITADAHLITLKDSFVGYVMPSKVYGCIASRRPILFVGSEQSDVAFLCQAAGGQLPWYRRVDVGDPAGVARTLEELALPAIAGEPRLKAG